MSDSILFLAIYISRFVASSAEEPFKSMPGRVDVSNSHQDGFDRKIGRIQVQGERGGGGEWTMLHLSYVLHSHEMRERKKNARKEANEDERHNSQARLDP